VIVGIDVGGSSIRAARVDVTQGALASPIDRVDLPQPATPERVLDAAYALAALRDRELPIGLALPSVIQHGIARTAANLDSSWIGTDVPELLRRRGSRSVVVLNDADAAGLAEMRYGAGRGLRGTVLVLTLGSGIGVAPFLGGRLWPNAELGHLCLPEPRGVEGEVWASPRTRTRDALDYAQWVQRLQTYLNELHRLLWPDAFILGGAISESYAEWGPLLHAPARVLPAQFRGAAGLVGAALAAA
jgi:polyphosphate glucokinase